MGGCGSAGPELLRPEFVGDKGQGGGRKWARGKAGFKNIHFVRKNRPFPGQNELQSTLFGLKRFLMDIRI